MTWWWNQTFPLEGQSWIQTYLFWDRDANSLCFIHEHFIKYQRWASCLTHLYSNSSLMLPLSLLYMSRWASSKQHSNHAHLLRVQVYAQIGMNVKSRKMVEHAYCILYSNPDSLGIRSTCSMFNYHQQEHAWVCGRHMNGWWETINGHMLLHLSLSLYIYMKTSCDPT